MKKALLFFVLLSALKICSQQIPKNSIIYLDEVVVTKKATKVKIKKVKTEGSTIAQIGAQKVPAQVSMVHDIPAGYLNYVTFYFNTGIINAFKKETNIKYEDTELSLILYTVNKDGTPGVPLMENPLRFIVKKEHRGEIQLNLKPLNLASEQQLFIGIESVSEQKDNTVVLRMQKNKDAITYNKGRDGKWYKWSFDDFNLQIKMDVGVAVER